jgi:hypothetical protein
MHVVVFEQDFALDDASGGYQVCSGEAFACV